MSSIQNLTRSLIGITFTFGRQKSSDGKNEEPIEWKIYDVNGTEVFLISNKVIESKKMHNTNQNVTWEESSIRKWLNEDFINECFNSEEKNRIVEKEIETFKKPRKDNISFKTKDKIFILDEIEVNKYLKVIKNKDNPKTVTLVNSVKMLGIPTNYVLTSTNIDRAAMVTKNKDEIKNIKYFCGYWLRSNGIFKNTFTIINKRGAIEYGGINQASDTIGIRPAMWVELKI